MIECIDGKGWDEEIKNKKVRMGFCNIDKKRNEMKKIEKVEGGIMGGKKGKKRKDWGSYDMKIELKGMVKIGIEKESGRIEKIDMGKVSLIDIDV